MIHYWSILIELSTQIILYLYDVYRNCGLTPVVKDLEVSTQRLTLSFEKSKTLTRTISMVELLIPLFP
ncbi:hypothetical protein NBX27_06810 [Erysipelothrix rhusiopathiae]|uniref:hypothetical protein n=1 Tax=Erysipelothrix rhusiopathiae TaxID=1648 RepID=UPI00202B5D09|nr:hypothetical protein [Erysipelothrix rhusiopathiae]URQ76959.1 hypothetical protein NBX27_06810 [Erysipelothrix rhusiopathiae]